MHARTTGDHIKCLRTKFSSDKSCRATNVIRIVSVVGFRQSSSLCLYNFFFFFLYNDSIIAYGHVRDKLIRTRMWKHCTCRRTGITTMTTDYMGTPPSLSTAWIRLKWRKNIEWIKWRKGASISAEFCACDKPFVFYFKCIRQEVYGIPCSLGFMWPTAFSGQ